MSQSQRGAVLVFAAIRFLVASTVARPNSVDSGICLVCSRKDYNVQSQVDPNWRKYCPAHDKMKARVKIDVVLFLFLV
jgi:hypothetical protein